VGRIYWYRHDHPLFYARPDDSEGLAGVGLNRKLGYIDKGGREVIPLKYESPPPNTNPGGFSEGLAFVRLNFKWGYIDRSGNEVIAFKYDKAYSFSGGLAVVELGREIGYIGRDGTEYFEP
jgi:hypothetical protein